MKPDSKRPFDTMLLSTIVGPTMVRRWHTVGPCVDFKPIAKIPPSSHCRPNSCKPADGEPDVEPTMASDAPGVEPTLF